MSETAKIAGLRSKVEGIIADNRKLRDAVAKLTTERDKVKGQKREAEEKIALLEKRVHVLEMAESFAGNGVDNRVAKLRINKLLREIDQCIALMNR